MVTGILLRVESCIKEQLFSVVCVCARISLTTGVVWRGTKSEVSGVAGEIWNKSRQTSVTQSSVYET